MLSATTYAGISPATIFEKMVIFRFYQECKGNLYGIKLKNNAR